MSFAPLNSGIAWMQFGTGHEDLLHYLQNGWPKPIPSAQWDHEKKWVDVFADDLFLCSECGQFYGLGREEQNQHDAQRKIQAMIRHPTKDIGSWDWRGLDPLDACRLREFAASRLNVPQFCMQPCKSQFCQQTKLRGIREFKPEIRVNEETLSPETRAFLQAKKNPKPAPSYASLVYLIHGSGHHKIGITIDTNKRLKGIQTSCPFPVEIVKTWKSENAQAVEQAMHRRFGEHRLNGEWFKLPDSILTMLNGIEDIDSEFLTND